MYICVPAESDVLDLDHATSVNDQIRSDIISNKAKKKALFNQFYAFLLNQKNFLKTEDTQISTTAYFILLILLLHSAIFISDIFRTLYIGIYVDYGTKLKNKGIEFHSLHFI